MSGIRPLLATALLALAVALIPIATGGWTALPAPLWVGGFVAALAIVALRRPGPPRAARDLPVAAAFGLAAAQAHLAPGLVLGHDAVDHAWGAWAYLQSWHAGDLWPLWLHQLGLGQPMPLFYGPLPFWAMAPFALAGGATSAMLSGSFALASVVASAGAWLAVGRWTGDRRAALVAALAMAYAPYRLLDANYRVGLGETWAIGLLPLALFAFERLLAPSSSPRRFALAAVATALVACAHPLSLVLLAFAAALLGVAHAAGGRFGDPREALRAFARGAAAGVVGLLLAGVFVVPLAAGLRALPLDPIVDASGRAAYAQLSLQPIELVSRRLWNRLEFAQVPSTDGSVREPELPLYVGLVLVGSLAAAALAGRRSAGVAVPSASLGLVGLACLALALDGGARLAAALPGVSILQFPWRFLGPATAAAALAAGLLAAFPPLPRLRGAGWATALALVALVDGFPHTGAVSRLPPWRDLVLVSRFSWGERVGVLVPAPWPLRVAGQFLPPNRCCADVGSAQLLYREYSTPAVKELSRNLARASVGLQGRLGATDEALRRVDALPYARRTGEGDALEPLEFTRGRGRIDVQLPDERGGRLVVAEQHFSGWQVSRGAGWSAAAATEEGLLTATVPPGVRSIRFRFDRWQRDRLAGWLSSLGTAAGLGWTLLAGARRRPRGEPSP